MGLIGGIVLEFLTTDLSKVTSIKALAELFYFMKPFISRDLGLSTSKKKKKNLGSTDLNIVKKDTHKLQETACRNLKILSQDYSKKK